MEGREEKGRKEILRRQEKKKYSWYLSPRLCRAARPGMRRGTTPGLWNAFALFRQILKDSHSRWSRWEEMAIMCVWVCMWENRGAVIPQLAKIPLFRAEPIYEHNFQFLPQSVSSTKLKRLTVSVFVIMLQKYCSSVFIRQHISRKRAQETSPCRVKPTLHFKASSFISLQVITLVCYLMLTRQSYTEEHFELSRTQITQSIISVYSTVQNIVPHLIFVIFCEVMWHDEMQILHIKQKLSLYSSNKL